MVGLGGLEPPTSPLSGARSNHLSYRPKDLRSGGADRDRTGDPLLAKQVLSQLSYSPDISGAGTQSPRPLIFSNAGVLCGRRGVHVVLERR